jgi:hypothetical protein
VLPTFDIDVQCQLTGALRHLAIGGWSQLLASTHSVCGALRCEGADYLVLDPVWRDGSPVGFRRGAPPARETGVSEGWRRRLIIEASFEVTAAR